MIYHRGESFQARVTVPADLAEVDGLAVTAAIHAGAPRAPVVLAAAGEPGVFLLDLTPETVPPSPQGDYGVSIWATWPDGDRRRVGGFMLELRDGTPGGVTADRPGTGFDIPAVRVIEGIPGPSAYEVAIADGFTGTRAEWLASLVGRLTPAEAAVVAAAIAASQRATEAEGAAAQAAARAESASTAAQTREAILRAGVVMVPASSPVPAGWRKTGEIVAQGRPFHLVSEPPSAALEAVLAPGALRLEVLWADPLAWFQDVAATVPVTAVGEPIRCWVSSGGVRFIQPQSSDRAPRAARLANGKWSALFDGSDDYLVSESAIDLTAARQLTLFAAVRKLTAPSVAPILFCDASSVPGYFGLAGRRSFLAGIGTAAYAAETRGPADYASAGAAESGNPQLAAPHSAVLTAMLAPAAAPGGAQLRINSAAAGQSSTSPGETSFLNQPIYLGSTPNRSNYFGGHIAQVGFRAGAIPATAAVTAAESILNQQLGAY